MAMYLTQVIKDPTSFWLISNKTNEQNIPYTASEVTSNIKNLFQDLYQFSAHLGIWGIDDSYVYNENGNKIDKILLVLPDDCTYEQFIKLHPEFII